MQSSTQFFPKTIESAYPIITETIPLTERGYKTNNKYPKFPPLMHDSRSITASWQHDAVTNAKIIETNRIKSNWEYRKYLTENAKSVMEQSFRESSNDLGYNSRFTEAPNIQSNQFVGKNTPAVYTSVYDNTSVLGRSMSDLKHDYLTREELHSRTFSPVITQEQLIKTMNQQ